MKDLRNKNNPKNEAEAEAKAEVRTKTKNTPNKTKSKKQQRKSKPIQFPAFFLRPDDLLTMPNTTQVTRKESFKIFLVLHQPGTELNIALVTMEGALCHWGRSHRTPAMPFSLTNTAAMALPPLADWILKHQEWMQLLRPQISVGTAVREEEQTPAMTVQQKRHQL